MLDHEANIHTDMRIHHFTLAGLALGLLLAWMCRIQRRRWRRRKLAKYGHSLCSIHITEADEFGRQFSKSQPVGKQTDAENDKIAAGQGKSIQLPAFSIHANATGRGGNISTLPAAAAEKRQSLDGGALGAAHALHRSIVSTRALRMHCNCLIAWIALHIEAAGCSAAQLAALPMYRYGRPCAPH